VQLAAARMWPTATADLVYGSRLETRWLFSGRPAWSSGSACPGVSEGQDLGGAVLPCDIRDVQCVAHLLARDPAVHLGDVFEDRVVQVLPSHAVHVEQHKPVAGSEDVGVVQVAPAPPGRRVPVFRIDPQLTHYVGRIAEYGNRPLRVVFNARANPARIVTVYFDRKMKGRL
jgi:hypothetical protein